MIAASGLMVTATFLMGCASVSVEREKWQEDRPPLKRGIVVEPFSAPPEGLRVDRESEGLNAFRSQLAAGLAGQLAERLTRHVAPARVLATGERLRPGDWLITGTVTRVEQGSRALRSVVGFGLGGTKMEVEARLWVLGHDGRRRPMAEFATTGGSNAEPGALLGGPFTAVPRLVMQATLTGVSADTRRTARTLTAAISEELRARGYPLAGEPLLAKRLGRLPGAVER